MSIGAGLGAGTAAGIGLSRPSAGITVDLRLYGILDVGVLGGDAAALAALAAGDAPFRKGETRPEDAVTKARTVEAPPERALASRPFAAVWDGKDHDAPAVKEGREKKDKDKDRKERKGKKKKG